MAVVEECTGNILPFLSVVIPTYNGENYIRESLESVLNQPCTDLEVLIVDDGSTDRTIEICKELQEKDSRIVLYCHENTGTGKNRNLGVERVRGTWTIFLDQDDMLLAGYYTSQMRELLKRCSYKNVQLIVTSRLRTDGAMQKCILETIPDYGLAEGGRKHSWDIEYEFFTMMYETKLIKRPELKFFEGRPDVESVYRHKAVYCAKKVLFAPDLFFSIKRDHEESVSSNWDFVKVLPVKIEVYIELIKWHLTYDPDDEEMIKECKKYVGALIRCYAMELYKTGANREEIKNILCTDLYVKHLDVDVDLLIDDIIERTMIDSVSVPRKTVVFYIYKIIRLMHIRKSRKHFERICKNSFNEIIEKKYYKCF